nr:hypothetical protein [Tanacetum cinerariifolium]
MSVLAYYAKHNMIAYLEKIEENAQFHEIVDFLSRSSIFYALTGTFGSGGDQVKLPHDSSLSCGHTSDRAEGSLNLKELSALCTNLSNRVLALETVKDAQAKEILTLKARIKKLEKRCKLSISHHRAWLRSVAKLSKMKKLGQMDSEAVDEGRTTNKTKELNLDADTEVIAEDKGSGEKGESTISTGRPKRVSTAGVTISTVDLEVSAVEPKNPPITTSIFDDEDIIMTQTLIKMKEEKAKEIGVAFKEVKESDRPTRSVLTLKPLPTIDPKDKGKAVLKEPRPKKMTISDFDVAQVARDEEIARQLEAELHKKVEMERQRVEQAYVDYIANLHDEVQARIDVDHELAVRLTHEEQEKYTVDERAKLLAGYFERRKKSDEDERLIQKMNEKAVDIHKENVLEEPNSTKVLKMKAKKKAGKQTHADDESSDKGVDNSKKRKAGPRMKRMFKRKKTDADLKEEENIKTFLKISSEEEEVVDWVLMLINVCFYEFLAVLGSRL